MNKSKGRCRRGLAFILSFILLLGNVNVNLAVGSTWSADEIPELVDISHTLTADKSTAVITVAEGSPGIRFTNVKMVRGTTLFASASNAEDVTASDALEAEEATASDALGAEEATASDALEAERVTASDALGATPSDAGEPEEATSSDADGAVDGPGGSGVGGVWTFVVDENRVYRFSVSYVQEEDGREVSETVSVNYEVDDIGSVTFLGADDTEIALGAEFDLLKKVRAVDEGGEELDTLTVKDDGNFLSSRAGTYKVVYRAVKPDTGMEYTKERMISVRSDAVLTITDSHPSGNPLEFAVDGDVSGLITVSYNGPSVQGRYIDLTFPRYIEVDNWPKDGFIDPARTELFQEEDHYRLRLGIRDGVTENMVAQISYSSKLKPWKTEMD